MTEENIEQFCKWYEFVNKRAEEICELRHPTYCYDGIEVEGNWIKINYSQYLGDGDYDKDYDYMSDEDLDENTNIQEKYKADYEEFQLQQMLAEEKREKEAKRLAQLKIEELKKQYGL